MDLTPPMGRAIVRSQLSDAEAAEERRLWADYYEATARALEIMRREGTPARELRGIP